MGILGMKICALSRALLSYESIINIYYTTMHILLHNRFVYICEVIFENLAYGGTKRTGSDLTQQILYGI